MPLTTKDIKQFARCATEYHSDVSHARTPELKAKFLHQHRLAALSYWDAAQDDVRDSGYRVTQRVKDVLWEELLRIADKELAEANAAKAPATDLMAA